MPTLNNTTALLRLLLTCSSPTSPASPFRHALLTAFTAAAALLLYPTRTATFPHATRCRGQRLVTPRDAVVWTRSTDVDDGHAARILSHLPPGALLPCQRLQRSYRTLTFTCRAAQRANSHRWLHCTPHASPFPPPRGAPRHRLRSPLVPPPRHTAHCAAPTAPSLHQAAQLVCTHPPAAVASIPPSSPSLLLFLPTVCLSHRRVRVDVGRT